MYIMKATRITLSFGSGLFGCQPQISQIYIAGCEKEGLYEKDLLYDYLIKHPRSIQVGIFPFPYLLPVKSRNGKKNVRSKPDRVENDNLFNLPIQT